MSYARCSRRTSALGWVARCVAISGPSTSANSGGDCHGALNRASRARTRRPVGVRVKVAASPPSGGPDGLVGAGLVGAGLVGLGLVRLAAASVGRAPFSRPGDDCANSSWRTPVGGMPSRCAETSLGTGRSLRS